MTPDVDADAAIQILQPLERRRSGAPARESRSPPCPDRCRRAPTRRARSARTRRSPCGASSRRRPAATARARAPRRSAGPPLRSPRATCRCRSPRRWSTASRSSASPGRRAAAPAPRGRDSAIDAFMSKTPGPYSRPSSSRSGMRSSCPTGHTVSKWPRRRTRPRPARELGADVIAAVVLRAASTRCRRAHAASSPPPRRSGRLPPCRCSATPGGRASRCRAAGMPAPPRSNAINSIAGTPTPHPPIIDVHACKASHDARSSPA